VASARRSLTSVSFSSASIDSAPDMDCILLWRWFGSNLTFVTDQSQHSGRLSFGHEEQATWNGHVPEPEPVGRKNPSLRVRARAAWFEWSKGPSHCKSGRAGGSDPGRILSLVLANLGIELEGFGDRVEAVEQSVALGFGNFEIVFCLDPVL